MLNFLEQMDNPFDVLLFLPNFDKKNNIKIQTNIYKNPGLPLNGNQIGPAWHVLLFKVEEDDVVDFDTFEAILSEPREYISPLIEQEWYGIVAKKTTTSHEFWKDAVAKFKPS